MSVSKSEWLKVIGELERREGVKIGAQMSERLLRAAETDGLFSVPDVISTPEAMAEELQEPFRRLKAAGERAGPPIRGTYQTPPLLSREEAKREEVFAWLIGLRAAELPLVRGFRTRFVGPRLLTRAEARTFLRSAPCRLLPGSRILAEGLPTIGLRGEEFVPGPTAYAPFGPRYIQRTEGGGTLAIRRLGIRCEWSSARGQRGRRELVIEVPESTRDTELESARARSFGLTVAGEGSMTVPGSPLDELMDTAEDLANRTWWPRPLAMMFVLTGEVPPTEAIRRELSYTELDPASQLRLTLTVQPWVSPDSVQKAYRDAQHRALGRERRRLEIDTLVRFRFAHELRHAQPGVGWPAIAEAWNTGPARRDRRRRTNRRSLQSEYFRTLETLLLPDLALGQREEDMEFVKALKRKYPTYRAELLARFRGQEQRCRAEPAPKGRGTRRKPRSASKSPGRRRRPATR